MATIDPFELDDDTVDELTDETIIIVDQIMGLTSPLLDNGKGVPVVVALVKALATVMVMAEADDKAVEDIIGVLRASIADCRSGEAPPASN